MRTLLANGYVFTGQQFERYDVMIDGNKAYLISPDATRVAADDSFSFDRIFQCNGQYISPGFTDVHVHLREPGFSYKETIKSGTQAAAAGGYTTVCTMPNLNPVPSNKEALAQQLAIIEQDALIHVIPYGTITAQQDGRSQLSDMEELAPFVVGFSDDGVGIQAQELMEEAMNKARTLNRPIVAHCEDETLLHGGYIHDGTYAKSHGHRGICSKSEWVQIERDVKLAEKTGCPYHICHVSTKESVAIIREAKAKGAPVTCETAPHYLILCDEDLQEDGRFKMNPPLRAKEDRAALIEGILDGTIDMIATDHAPHSAEEKARGLEGSAFGIVGLESAFALLKTHLVDTKIITLEKLVQLMAVAPRKIFNLSGPIALSPEPQPADLVVFNPSTSDTICAKHFLSKGKATPFDGEKVSAQIVMTICDGEIVYVNCARGGE
ncbi:dihydroorotase [Allofustis seminis]|uniref:dihydroorotase n=1 Tax=Allofustis seminis TaxID=166939 RepID=UPI000369B973|nr:dihydroorotase [Allofustis seminis]